ncbi:MAG: hypothetical protein WCO31_00930 [Actinomycetes bacterium]
MRSPAGGPRVEGSWIWAKDLWATWSGLAHDAVLFGLSAVFALGTWQFSGIALYRQWGLIAIWGYAAGAIAAYVLLAVFL